MFNITEKISFMLLIMCTVSDVVVNILQESLGFQSLFCHGDFFFM